MKKNLLLNTVLCFVSLLLSCKNDVPQKLSFEAMNTFMTIQSYGINAEKANAEAKNAILHLENKISVNEKESDIYRINNASVFPQKIDEDTSFLIDFSIRIAESSNGALNPALYPVTKAWGFTTGKYEVPSQSQIDDLLKLTDYKKIHLENNSIILCEGMEIDLGAIGKGYAGDKAIAVLKKNGITSALLDLGGNIQLIGSKPDGRDWIVGLKNPFGGEIVAAVKVSDCAVITSGGYERYFQTEDGKSYIHIFDSKTGYPVDNNVASCTIITKKGVYGDALSTTLFVLGKEGAVQFWKKNPDFDFIMILDDNSILYTENLSPKISLLQSFKSVEIIK